MKRVIFSALFSLWSHKMMIVRAVVLAFATLAMSVSVGLGSHALAADMTFQFVNDTDRPLNLKLFSRGESLQMWPAKSKAYSLRPDTATQQLKISCTEGENICWGAWMTVQSVSGQMAGSQRATSNYKTQAGVGERGTRECADCCKVCKEGAVVAPVKLNNSIAVGPDVR
jgi:hypothetical protein